MKKRFFGLLFACLLTVSLLSGCFFSGYHQMPFNGDITFHEISLKIDEKFIRDSTQSSEDMWIFEYGNYKEYIILSRKNATEDTTSTLNSYVEYLVEQGAEAELTTFMECEAVYSSYTKDGKYCQEILFAYGQSLYAVALRGGDRSGFEALINTIQIQDEVKT